MLAPESRRGMDGTLLLASPGFNGIDQMRLLPATT